MNRRDDDNQVPTGQRGQRWGGQVRLTTLDTEAFIERPRKNRVGR